MAGLLGIAALPASLTWTRNSAASRRSRRRAVQHAGLTLISGAEESIFILILKHVAFFSFPFSFGKLSFWSRSCVPSEQSSSRGNNAWTINCWDHFTCLFSPSIFIACARPTPGGLGNCRLSPRFGRGQDNTEAQADSYAAHQTGVRSMTAISCVRCMDDAGTDIMPALLRETAIWVGGKRVRLHSYLLASSCSGCWLASPDNLGEATSSIAKHQVLILYLAPLRYHYD